MTTRVYVATSLAELAQWVGIGRVPQGGARFVAPDESEESEYAALAAAAEASYDLLSGTGRRVVVVADVPAEDDAFSVSDIAAVHADPVDGAARDDDLAWYATQEMADLLG